MPFCCNFFFFGGSFFVCVSFFEILSPYWDTQYHSFFGMSRQTLPKPSGNPAQTPPLDPIIPCLPALQKAERTILTVTKAPQKSPTLSTQKGILQKWGGRGGGGGGVDLILGGGWANMMLKRGGRVVWEGELYFSPLPPSSPESNIWENASFSVRRRGGGWKGGKGEGEGESSRIYYFFLLKRERERENAFLPHCGIFSFHFLTKWPLLFEIWRKKVVAHEEEEEEEEEETKGIIFSFSLSRREKKGAPRVAPKSFFFNAFFCFP